MAIVSAGRHREYRRLSSVSVGLNLCGDYRGCLQKKHSFRVSSFGLVNENEILSVRIRMTNQNGTPKRNSSLNQTRTLSRNQTMGMR